MRQLTFSAMRELADCSTGALWPSSEAGHDDGEHAGGVDLLGRQERDVRRGEGQRGVEHRVVDAAADVGEDERRGEADQDAAARRAEEVPADLPRG